MNNVFEKIKEKLEEIYDNHGSSAESYNEALIKRINQVAEEYNNGWIPCDKKLPEENEDVLIQFDNDDMAVAHLEEVSYKEYQWYVNIDKDNFDSTMEEVIAWQPLPGPYQPKGEKKDARI